MKTLVNLIRNIRPNNDGTSHDTRIGRSILLGLARIVDGGEQIFLFPVLHVFDNARKYYDDFNSYREMFHTLINDKDDLINWVH